MKNILIQNQQEATSTAINPQAVAIEFSETMRGYVDARAATFVDGYAAGQAKDERMTIHLSVKISDLDSFLKQPQHAGTLSGQIVCPLLGGICQVQSGTFRLMRDTADLDRKVMVYEITACNPHDELLTFIGQKQIQRNAALDLWQDTTTLFVNVFRGQVNPDQITRAELWATGIVSLDLGDFIHVLRSLRATDASGETSFEGLAKFGGFFAGKLWDVYGPHVPPAPNQPQRRYAIGTNEGVTGAEITSHPFCTADGLGLQLTRFSRAWCDDVVLIVHGLTNSTDMFIMPEHRNLVQTLLDEGFGDVWSLDYRGSRRFPYNLQRSRYTLDDIALFDHPAAIAELRRHIGPQRRIHVIAHCVGALTMAMSVFGRTVQGISSMIFNSVALTPVVPRWSEIKLALGPWISDYLIGVEYYSPSWRRQPGWSIGKMISIAADLTHRECNSPECHMLSFMWGSGRPAVFNHSNLATETHDRLGDLFGGAPVHYYRHIHKMVKSDHTAIKFDATNPRYAALPDDYFTHVAEIETPMLLIQGQDNRIFADSNIRCHVRLEKVVPGRHQLRVFPGYGHQDVFMGKNVHIDVFPHLIEFLRQHCHD